MEERFVDLEIRISHQEAVLKDMAKRIIELENDRTINERPPHY